MEDVISISNIKVKGGFPGMSESVCGQCYEACIVCLYRSKHTDGVQLSLRGVVDTTVMLHWEDDFDDQKDRTWKDQEECTESAAVCLSILLVKKYTEYTIVERARKGTGIDYWLAKDHNIMFQKAARLEISGIFKEDQSNSIDKRFVKKKKQTGQSDGKGLPAYVSIIEFGVPRAFFAIK
jgi:hypothetical protein